MNNHPQGDDRRENTHKNKDGKFHTRVFRKEESTVTKPTLHKSFVQKNNTPNKQAIASAFVEKKKFEPRQQQNRNNHHRGHQQRDHHDNNEDSHDNLVSVEPFATEGVDRFPVAEKDVVRVVPVCGVEGIGTNMFFIEYNDQIVVLDAGLGFATEATPGINYTIPDVSYLKLHKHKIKALVITHGHLDHVGGIPFVMEAMGMPPIYTREFGALFIKKKLSEYPHLKNVEIRVVEKDDGYLKLSEDLKVKFFGLTHSIPDSTGVIIMTPLGGVLSTGDVRVESINGEVYQSEYDQYAFLKDENILLGMIDSTGIEKTGWSIPEDTVVNNVDQIIKDAPGRLLISCFASQVERIIQFTESAKKHGKYVFFDGRSLQSNMAIVDFLKLSDFQHVYPIEDIDKYPPHKVVIILTGSQGEKFAALDRLINKSHRFLRFQPTDTVVLSSSIIPGNDYPITQLKNALYRNLERIITYTDTQVHASGHGTREELLWIHRQIGYKYFAPVHGEPYMTRLHARLAKEVLGVQKDNILICDNGSVMEFRNNGELVGAVLDKKLPTERIIVDGGYVGPMRQVVMDDRIRLGESGIFTIVVTLDPKTLRFKKSPDILSRGTVYLRDSQKLLNNLRNLTKRTIEYYLANCNGNPDFDEAKKILGDKVAKYIAQKIDKEPIVIPVIISV